MKTVIEMAREAGFTQPEGETWYEAFPQCIARFAELVRAEAVAKEREECAKVCDDLDDDLPDGLAGWQYGDAIRARSST